MENELVEKAVLDRAKTNRIYEGLLEATDYDPIQIGDEIIEEGTVNFDDGTVIQKGGKILIVFAIRMIYHGDLRFAHWYATEKPKEPPEDPCDEDFMEEIST